MSIVGFSTASILTSVHPPERRPDKLRADTYSKQHNRTLRSFNKWPADRIAAWGCSAAFAAGADYSSAGKTLHCSSSDASVHTVGKTQTCPASRVPLPMGDLAPSKTWFLWAHKSALQTTSRSFQPFCRAHWCQWCAQHTGRQIDR